MLKIIKTKRKYIPKENKLIESVRETYYDFIDFIENPVRVGYMAVLCKLKPQSKEPIRARFLDSWQRIDKDLRKIRNRMRKIMGWYDDDQPDGIKG